ncbi:MAG: hypothetical protein JKY37_09920, partial [Nannocystaceae bacterium]|nr:hypothetical protein [Nannocystaceae bacterium]
MKQNVLRCLLTTAASLLLCGSAHAASTWTTPANPVWEVLHVRDGSSHHYTSRVSAEMTIQTVPGETLVFRSGTITALIDGWEVGYEITPEDFAENLHAWKNGSLDDITGLARFFRAIPPSATAVVLLPKTDWPRGFVPTSLSVELEFNTNTFTFLFEPQKTNGVSGRFPLEDLELGPDDDLRWNVIGHDRGDHHRLAIQWRNPAVDGVPLQISQRYALDLQLQEIDGDVLRNDCEPSDGRAAAQVNECYHAWNKHLTAMGDGEVVDLVRDVPDNTIAGQIDTVDFNYLILKLNSGDCVYYSHIKQYTIPDSIVKGTTVSAGEVIG